MCRECLGFRYFFDVGEGEEGEGKEEDFIIKMLLGSRIFSFRCGENTRFFGTFRGLERIGEGKERKMIYCENPLNSAKRQQGFLFGYAENDRFFTVFYDWKGCCEGKERKRF